MYDNNSGQEREHMVQQNPASLMFHIFKSGVRMIFWFLYHMEHQCLYYPLHHDSDLFYENLKLNGFCM